MTAEPTGREEVLSTTGGGRQTYHVVNLRNRNVRQGTEFTVSAPIGGHTRWVFDHAYAVDAHSLLLVAHPAGDPQGERVAIPRSLVTTVHRTTTP